MANLDKKITDLDELTTPADEDYIPIVDISDVTDDVAGTSKKVKRENIASIDTDGTLSTNSDVKIPSQKAVKTYVDTNSVFVNVKEYGAVGDGVTDDRDAIQDALDAVDGEETDGAGGTLFFPSGIYLCSGNLTIGKQTTIQGNGIRSSMINFTHTGDGINSTNPINSSTSVHLAIRDIRLYNNNASNTGGGFVDVGGSLINLGNMEVTGFKYGIILDQSEVVSINECHINNQIHTGIWLVNGAEHTIGAATNYTNRIDIKSCQFNHDAGTAYSIVDDGGSSHNVIGCNFNGGIACIYAANTRMLNVTGCEFENEGDYHIFIDNDTEGGVNVGGTWHLNVYSNEFYPADVANTAIRINSPADRILLLGNYFGNYTNTPVTGAPGTTVVEYANNRYGGGDIIDT